MIPLLRLRESLVAEGAMLALSTLLVRIAHPELARSRAGRAAGGLALAVVAGAHVAWALPNPIATCGVDVAMVLLPILGLLAASLVPATAVSLALRRVLLPKTPAPAPLAEPDEGSSCGTRNRNEGRGRGRRYEVRGPRCPGPRAGRSSRSAPS